MGLPSFSAAVLFWAEEWRNKTNLTRELDPRNVVDHRARIRSYWECCDERHTHAAPDIEEVLTSVRSIFEEAMRVELVRIGEIHAAQKRAAGQPFLAGIVGILEAGEPGARKAPKLVAGRDVRRGKAAKGGGHG
jgi:hypothetical protein